MSESTEIEVAMEMEIPQDGNIEAEIEKDGENTTTHLKETNGSIFGDWEAIIGIIWLIYTSIYWTASIWIPILITQSFDDGYGLLLWGVGFVGMLTCGITLYKGHYPSGSTKTNKMNVNGAGRYTTIIMTFAVIADTIILLIISVVKHIDNQNAIYIRLLCHMIQLLWTSLFFFNKFFLYAKISSIQTFIYEWGNIIYSAAIVYIFTINDSHQNEWIHRVYAYFICSSIILWMCPMLLIKGWGASQYMRGISIHCIILDILTNIPVLIVLFITGEYKTNILLNIDILIKVIVLIRSFSFGIAYFAMYWEDDADQDNKYYIFDSPTASFLLTGIWVFVVITYWTICTFIVVFEQKTIGEQFDIYTWFFGMIGCSAIFYCLTNGYTSDSSNGPIKAIMGITCLIICIDWIVRAFGALNGSELTLLDIITSVFHSIAILTSVIFFSGYKKENKYKVTWITLLIEYIDIILMFSVICFLHIKYNQCLQQTVCVAYCICLTVKILLWFIPLILGSSNSKKGIHIHMLLLDFFTDFPLIIIIILTKGYKLHTFIFIDIVYKVVFVLLRSVAYHCVANLILTKLGLEKEQPV